MKCPMSRTPSTSITIPRTAFQHLWRAVATMPGLVASLTGITLVHAMLGLLPVYLMRPLIDDVLTLTGTTAHNQRLFLFVVALVALYASRTGVEILLNWLGSILGNTLTHTLRHQLYSHTQLLPIAKHDQHTTGSILSCLNQDVSRMQEFLVAGAKTAVQHALQIVGIGVMLFLLRWQLALIMLIPAPMIVGVAGMLWGKMKEGRRESLHCWAGLNMWATETLQGIRVIKICAQEPRMIARFRVISEEVRKANITADRTWAIGYAGFHFITLTGTFLAWYLGGRAVLAGEMSLGTLVVFVTFTGLFYAPMHNLALWLQSGAQAEAAAERIRAITDAPTEESEETAQAIIVPSSVCGRLTFSDVSFGYQREQMVIHHCSFDIAAGEMIGLIGHSGAGKSTLINLLCRFYPVTHGRILLDGRPIEDYSLAAYRQLFGVVAQQVQLFQGTIAENIAFANPTATREEVRRAAEIANAHTFIRGKPDGYDTVIGEGGCGLSGGELQRLAIARAVLRDPPILIFDEATSHLDGETEWLIQEAIACVVRGRTTIAIAHRLSTVQESDRLLVLRQGRLVEEGTHPILQADPNSEYARLMLGYQVRIAR